MEQFLWFVLAGLLLAAFIVAVVKMNARSKREEEGMSPEELRRKRAIERLAGDL